MSKKEKDTVYAGSFSCRIPLILLEKCVKCVRNGKCKNIAKLLNILRKKKRLDYKKPD